MELAIFGRFHARAGETAAVEAATREVLVPSSGEAGCVAVNAYRSMRDERLFFIHSRRVGEAAFERHAAEPHTRCFIARVTPLIDRPLDVQRAHLIDCNFAKITM
jgi:quinol monooxygenase YgiN